MPAPTEQPTCAATGGENTGPPPFARGPVLLLAGLAALLLLLVSGRYGYLSDELYFIAAGKHHLDWGYMDQQPLVPLLAAAIDAVAPGSLLALRLPAALIAAFGIAGTALLARELGADRRAQVIAAAACALSPWLLLSGHWLAAATLEPAQWLALLWPVARWVRLHRAGIRRDRLLLLAGVVAAVGVQTKFQIVLLCAALLLGVLISGPRELLRRPALWAGALLAAVAAAPALAWQIAHGWPAVDMAGVVGGETDRLLLLPAVLLYAGPVVGAALCCFGTWCLLRDERLRPVRFLGWAVLLLAAFHLLASGRPNYLSGLYGLLFAAGAVGLRHRRTARWSWVVGPAFAVSAVLPLALLPLAPLPVAARHPQLAPYSRMYETGWPELTATVAAAYRSLPPEQRRRTALVAETYHLAAALDVLGPAAGLPPVHSPNRGYWYFGAPPDGATVLLYVGAAEPLAPHFAERTPIARVRTGPVVNLAQGVSVLRYSDPVRPWSRLWPLIRTG
ncbi:MULTISPECIES: glycosyltransferase family 39 protein [unclassified Saccharopolyspora]|uniref:glycosyltransferase family 39 protein n=1 Tax=unclassified Saccharopolyspora TaxID=2646250 RepID=UPI001CD5E157|nr:MULTISPECIES: glycosyltransferase family 39 protein [unclassified Saccharopolyspora]MCA1189915.1 glycosyltransferase family 39 protein [Saccharopolyspora sp. 6T]MCA1195822.1 glycosyltransferase family 39 protein [Saccharopolyspora sp. 6V]MCA1229429.1 glycosyltransferase family 39 protein [Saccharopolyspora sp. 6M]MCA1283285.1 glycosyltransferase family 39 protein [Saccharopolyspora sp. 7B]